MIVFSSSSVLILCLLKDEDQDDDRVVETRPAPYDRIGIICSVGSAIDGRSSVSGSFALKKSLQMQNSEPFAERGAEEEEQCKMRQLIARGEGASTRRRRGGGRGVHG